MAIVAQQTADQRQNTPDRQVDATRNDDQRHPARQNAIDRCLSPGVTVGAILKKPPSALKIAPTTRTNSSAIKARPGGLPNQPK